MVDGSNVSFPVAGPYNVGSFGPVGKVLVYVKQTDADGSNPVFPDPFEAGLPPMNPKPNSGSYSKLCTVSYTSGKRYLIKVILYNDSTPNQPLVSNGYTERYLN